MSIRQNLWLLSFASPFFAILLASDTQAASPAVEKRLAELKQAYEAAIERQAGTAANAAIKALDAKYTAALDRFIISSTQAGKLEEAIALRDEKKRVSDGMPLPADDSDATEALKPLRGTYRSQLAEIEATREKQIGPLKERYLQELTKLQTDTTKTGNLEDALAVKTVIEGMGNAASPSQAPDESPGKPVIAKGNGKTDPKAAQAICEWALANGAVVTTDQGKVGANEKLKSVVKSKVSIKAIYAKGHAASFPWELIPQLGEIESINIDQNEAITASQVQHLNGLPILEELFIKAPLSQLTLQSLPNLPKIHTLFIHQTGEEDLNPALSALAKLYPDLESIGWCPRDGIDNLEGCKLLAAWPKLLNITLRGDLSADSVDALASLKQLTALTLLGNGTIDPANLPKLKNLTHLQVSFGKHLKGLVPAAAQLPRLQSFRCSLAGRSPEDLEAVKDFSSLNHLTLKFAGAASSTDSFMPKLLTARKVTFLDILDSDLTDQGLKILEEMKSLETLVLTDCRVTEQGLKAFIKARPKCEIRRDKPVY